MALPTQTEAMPLGTRSVAEALPAERLAFVRKVYGLFFISLLFALGAGVYTVNTSLFLWFIAHPILAIVIFFAGVFLVHGVSRVPGVNVIALFGYAAFTGTYFSLIALASYFVSGGAMEADKITGTVVLTGGSWNLAGQAFGLTMMGFGGLTLFAFVSRKDFSFLGGILTVAAISLIGVFVISFFFGGFSSGIELVFVLGVIVVMCGYVLYDTSNIIRRYPTTMAVSASLSLYLNFAILFIYLLRLLMILQRR